MELVTQTAKMRVYKTSHSIDALRFAALFNGSYFYNHSADYWCVILGEPVQYFVKSVAGVGKTSNLGK